MSKHYDFSNSLIRCSSLYYIMAQGKTRTPKQQYDYLQTILVEEIRKYENMGERRQGMANGIKKAAKIAGLEYELNLLEPKKHIDPLPQGAKSYLKRIYAELKYGKWSITKDKDIKFTAKGKLVEADSLALISKLDEINYKKNEVRIVNPFLTGMPDTFIGEDVTNAHYIVDVKSSWDIETFMSVIASDINPLYWWQNQGYYALTGAKAGEVSYCLVNTPETLINDERFYLARQMDCIDQETPEFKQAEAILVNNLTFDDMPEAERRFKFTVDRDDEAIEKIYETIPKCREFLSEFQELHLKGRFTVEEIINEPVEELVD